MKSRILRLALLMSLVPARMAAAVDEADAGPAQRVDVVVDMTVAGDKVPHPTRGHPTYYFPLPVGYTEQGEVQTYYQRTQPPAVQIEHMIAVALAREGYLVANKAHPPSIVLMFWWGYIGPIFSVPPKGAPDGSGQLLNFEEMNEMVRGDSLGDPQKSILEENLREAARVPRWYMRVSALDFDDWAHHHKITPLWRAHVSTDLWGHYLDEVLPQLVATGVPFFGRKTTPQIIDEPAISTGHVEVGTPVLKGNSP